MLCEQDAVLDLEVGGDRIGIERGDLHVAVIEEVGLIGELLALHEAAPHRQRGAGGFAEGSTGKAHDGTVDDVLACPLAGDRSGGEDVALASI